MYQPKSWVVMLFLLMSGIKLIQEFKKRHRLIKKVEKLKEKTLEEKTD